MDDFTVRQSFRIPSLGKIYKEEIPEEITLRSMTVNEEMMRLGVDDSFKSLAELLDACIETNIKMSTYDMCLSDFTFLIQKLRVVTYGDIYPMQTTCPYCHARHAFDVPLSAIPVTYYNDEMLKYKKFILPVSNHEVTLNYTTPRMVDSINRRFRDLKRETEGAVKSDLLLQLQCSIDTIDEKEQTMEQKEIFLRQLPMRDINKITQAIKELTDYMGLSSSVEIECDACHVPFETYFNQGSDFFRPAEVF